MKAKAASKSTNWNLRVMASRPWASCQSGSRFNACFRSSIASLLFEVGAMETSQGIFLFDTVNAAVAGQLAGIKTEVLNRKFVAGEERIVRQPLPDPLQLRMAQARQGDVGGKFVRVLRLANATDGGIHLALQMLQQIVLPRRGPQSVRLLVAELADTVKLHVQGGRINAGQRIVQSPGIAAIHLADEA